MKKIVVLFLMLVCVLSVHAQQPQQFDPAKFDAELEQYITTEAGLAPKEAAAFFPLYREMLRKQRLCYDELRRTRHMDSKNDKACADMIAKRDKLEIQMKEIQQQYHSKFMRVLPAGKVFRIINAKENFHRNAFRRVTRPMAMPNMGRPMNGMPNMNRHNGMNRSSGRK